MFEAADSKVFNVHSRVRSRCEPVDHSQIVQLRYELHDVHNTGKLCIWPLALCFNKTKITLLEPQGWSVWKASDKARGLPPNICKRIINAASSNRNPSDLLQTVKVASLIHDRFVVSGRCAKIELRYRTTSGSQRYAKYLSSVSRIWLGLTVIK